MQRLLCPVHILTFIFMVLLSSACAFAKTEVVDGLPVLSPKDAGIAESFLAEMEGEIDEHYPMTSGVVIIRNGHLVYEHYRYGQDEDTLMEIFSVTKSVTSILTGIAIEKGAIKSLDAELAPFLPDYFASDIGAEFDPRTREITVEQLLTMSSGLHSGWDLEGRPINVYRGDLFQKALDLGQTHEPGGRSQYSTVVSNLLSGVIATATEQDLEDYGAEKLFEPLGIESWHWYRDDDDRPTASAGLMLRTRDMAKIGLLMLNSGIWNGEQIVPAEWVAASTSPQVQTNLWAGQTHGYGYLWWIKEGAEEQLPVYFANGYGGQYIVVAPEFDLVVAISSRCCMTAEQGWNAQRLVTDYVIPALQ